MNSRESILAKLEKVCPTGGAPKEPPTFSGREVYSDYPEERLVENFQRKFAALRGEIIISSSMEELAKGLAEILGKLPEGDIVAQDLPLPRAVLQRMSSDSRPVRREEKWAFSNEEFARFAAGITTADAFISRTGSVVLRSSTAGGRRLSVLPPVHIVIGTTSQVVPSHEYWLAQISKDNSWSFGTIISGPSRTGDIEKILVLGAHGPKRLIVCLLDDRRS